MSEAPVHLRLPGKPELVTETVARFDTAGLRGALLHLDTPTLQDLGLRLTDRKLTVADAAEWLNKELGGSKEEPIVPERNVHRFAEHFRRIYAQVRAEHVHELSKRTVRHVTAGRVKTMRGMAEARLMDLITEKLVATDNLEEMSATELSATIATLDSLAKGEIKGQELALKVAESERKTQRLEADLRKRELELQQLQDKIDLQQREHKTRATQAVAAAEATASGGGGAEAVVSKVREILGLA